MTIFFNILTHFLIIVGIIGMFVFVAMMISSERNWLEKVIKTAAMITGLLIYFGSKSIGISIPPMIFAFVRNSNPIIFGLFGLILPAAAGVFVSWYCLKNIRRSEIIASRIVIMISSFIAIMFGDVYAATYQIDNAGDAMNTALLPNLTFVVGLSLYVIFKYETGPAMHGQRYE